MCRVKHGFSAVIYNRYKFNYFLVMIRYPSTRKKTDMARAVIRDFPGLHSGNNIQGGYVSRLAGSEFVVSKLDELLWNTL